MTQSMDLGAVGFDWTAARQGNRLPWGGTKGEAQSERQRRGPRHSIDVSQATANLSGPMQPRQGQSDGAARASKIAEAWGLTRPDGGASRPMPSAQTLSNQQDKHNVEGKKGMNAQTKFATPEEAIATGPAKPRAARTASCALRFRGQSLPMSQPIQAPPARKSRKRWAPTPAGSASGWPRWRTMIADGLLTRSRSGGSSIPYRYEVAR